MSSGSRAGTQSQGIGSLARMTIVSRRYRVLLTSALAALAAGTLHSPSRAHAQNIPALSDSVVVSLISILPGDDLYSLFGHSALRVRDPVTGVDVAYNFGTFDFGDSAFALADFVARFSYGDLNYSLTKQDPVGTAEAYWRLRQRASVEQTLDLTPDEARELFRRLEVNALPENRFYQYDFFFDNCATRLLDVLEAVIGPKLSFAGAPDPGLSFRELLDPFLTDDTWIDLGMDLGLGLPADRTATPREATFLPERLMDYLAAARIDRGDGVPTALVTRTEMLAGPATETWDPGDDPNWPAIAGWLLFALGALLTLADARAGRTGRPVVDGLFFGVLGVAGLAVAFLWFVSLHDVAKTNLNLGWALPTHLVLAVALFRSSGARWAGIYLVVTAALAAVLLVGMPVWPQELPVAVAPLLLLIVVRAGWLAWTRLASVDGATGVGVADAPPATPPA